MHLRQTSDFLVSTPRATRALTRLESPKAQPERQTMKSRIAFAVLAALSAAPAAFAQSYTDEARVVEARPVVERIPIKREECWNERVRGYENRTVTRSDTGAAIGPGTILGAVIGGVVGHQFGNSSGGRDRGTAAGAIVGGLVGNQVDRENSRGEPVERVQVERVPPREIERCRLVEEVREATVGWDVRYVYGNREFSTRMPFDPGRRLTVAVNVKPIEDRVPDVERRGPRPSNPRY